MKVLIVTGVLVLSLGANAQSFSEGSPADAPALKPPSAPPMPPPQLNGFTANPGRPPEVRNTTNVLGAASLGAGKRGQLFLAGFPLVSLKALFGVGDQIDLGLAFDSFWGVMNELQAVARVTFVRGENWSFGGSFEGGGALFGVKASRELRGARWLTGRRNYNFSPALTVSYRGSAVKAVGLSFTTRYMLTLDNEPFSRNPLEGVPPLVIVGHNVHLQFGAEFPVSSTVAFAMSFALEFHGRPEDSVIMPSAQLGVVTSL